MTNLAEVLAWKFDNAAGIRTRSSSGGGMEIFDWPAALGPKPTAAKIATWTAQFDALPAPTDGDLADGEITASRFALGLVRLLGKRFNLTEQQVRDAIKAEL